MKKVIAPELNYLKFYSKITRDRKRMFNLIALNNIKDKKFIQINEKYLTDALLSKKPIIVPVWHHGVESAIYDFNQNVIVTTSQQPNIKNTLSLTNDLSMQSLIKIVNLSKKDMAVTIAIDGPEGNKNFKVKILGSDFYISRGYYHIIKAVNPIILPITHYTEKNLDIVIKWHSPLFSNCDIQKLDESEIISETINFFIQDMIAENNFGIDYIYSFCRYLKHKKLYTP